MLDVSPLSPLRPSAICTSGTVLRGPAGSAPAAGSRAVPARPVACGRRQRHRERRLAERRPSASPAPSESRQANCRAPATPTDGRPTPVVPGDHEVPGAANSRLNISSARRSDASPSDAARLRASASVRAHAARKRTRRRAARCAWPRNRARPALAQQPRGRARAAPRRCAAPWRPRRCRRW